MSCSSTNCRTPPRASCRRPSCASSFAITACPTPPSSADRLDHVLDDFLGVAKYHHGLVHVEQLVVQAGIARGHGALVDDDGLGLVGLEDGHAGDWRFRVV